MIPVDLKAPALAVLDALEVEEAKLLAWGLVDGGFTRGELADIAITVLDERGDGVDEADVILALQDAYLLHRFSEHGEDRYRTRTAESVRLFARLRQVFPGKPWESAPTLVADFRFSMRRRVYPRRHIGPAKVMTELEADKPLMPSRKKALQALLDSPGRTLQLADFQLRATRRMLDDLDSSKSRGMIVCAGTGTGKTLSFYLPALAHLAGLVATGQYWTKALAIYPRNELLKDQFSETYVEARRLDDLLTGGNQRKLTIGAYFGPTPKYGNIKEVADKWNAHGGGYACPYLRCPSCEGTLVWKNGDIEQQRERLHCATAGCGSIVREDEVCLTRTRMCQQPPDVVFTTTEMLNRSISDDRCAHVFGVGAARSPHMLLLDEVHTYGGTTGAQVALLLRRWQHAVGAKVQFTGLSATLRNAGEFFATLVGLSVGVIEEIQPGEDLEAEGMEYQLALRGDPVSGASLLSTSIQTSMLLRRVLDPLGEDVSGGALGQKVFVFTDDLDVTNRLFHNMLDAEGLNSRGLPAGKYPLAVLRAASEPNPAGRMRHGQNWRLCEDIGHDLSRPMRIGRTSSQDTGVDRQSDVVVATASLEVGFNDPTVGAVIQHKAPRDVASFLQRKGRAGRRRGMRPWTVVVLSDYGRDRLAYQGYDALFDPVLDERTLPVSNRYVQRMQATYAFIDWVACQLKYRGAPKGQTWMDLAGPLGNRTEPWSAKARQRRTMAAELVREVLEDARMQSHLERHLRLALQLSASEVQALMWEPPRALMTAVLPTLLRRLRTDWTRMPLHGSQPEVDYYLPTTPLPDFVPANLFSDLLLPEVTVNLPATRPNAPAPKPESLGILQALRAFAPGRVTRRFGVAHALDSHWIAPPDFQSPHQVMPVESFCTEFDEAGTYQMTVAGAVIDVRCVRPWAIAPTLVPPDIVNTSNAQLVWRTQIVPPGPGAPLDVARHTPWADFIEDVRFFTHNQRAPIEVRRFALGSDASIRLQRGGKTVDFDTQIRFVSAGDDRPAAVGFAQSVDAIVFRFRMPEGFGIDPNGPNAAKVRAYRTAYFRHRLAHHPRLEGLANGFQREWLHQIYLSWLCQRAMMDGKSLESVQATHGPDVAARELEGVLDNIFRTLPADTDHDDDGTGRQRVHARLVALTRQDEVHEALRDSARALWEAPDAGWHQWAIERFRSTLGAALLDACTQLSPQAASADLIVDLDPGPRPDGAFPTDHDLAEIWVSESTVGGGGVIEEIQRRYVADPALFFRLVESALAPSDFEIVDAELTRLLDALPHQPAISDALDSVRFADGHQALVAASTQLHQTLALHGVHVTHPVMAALNARIVRPGSNQGTDNVLRDMIMGWKDAEAELGVEVDARVFAYVASTSYNLDQALAHLGVPSNDPTWRFQTIYGLLWPRGQAVRAQALAGYNPFEAQPSPDREIVLDALRPTEERINLADPAWRQRVEAAFQRGATVALAAPATDREALSEAVRGLVADPVDTGFLHVYPLVEAIVRRDDAFEARLRIREVIQ
jgi:superfamily II DNA or RNA helicase